MRQTIIVNALVRPRPSDLNQLASTKPGAIQTALWLGDYYRTYPTTVQAEVTAALARPEDFVHGPMAVRRDSPAHPDRGFVVRDGAYLSARWPGDAHRFAREFADMLERGA